MANEATQNLVAVILGFCPQISEENNKIKWGMLNNFAPLNLNNILWDQEKVL